VALGIIEGSATLITAVHDIPADLGAAMCLPTEIDIARKTNGFSSLPRQGVSRHARLG